MRSLFLLCLIGLFLLPGSSALYATKKEKKTQKTNQIMKN